MSGPIVRRYGFPNFEKIFGHRPLEHGIDESAGGDSSAKIEQKLSGPSAPSDVSPEASEPKRPSGSQ
jgi:hypothetical protein